MTDADHCYQNAVAERVNGILKDEFDLDTIFESFSKLSEKVIKVIDIYNSKRSHFSLDLQTPLEVHYDTAA
jgi:putative transposase